jgi:hypothetical protein
MQRPTRRSRLGIVASLVTIVATTVLTAAPTVLASEPGTEGASGGALTRLPNLHSGSRGSIDVSKLAGSASSSPARPQHGYLAIPTPASLGSSGGVSTSAVAPPPVQATTTSNTAATGPEWPGFSFTDVLAEPPDPWVAVGPDHVVQTVNTQIQMFDREGNLERAAAEIGVGEFFNLPAGYFNSDPRVIYDRLHGRWIGTEVSWTCDGNENGTPDDPVGYIDFIVSRTADPTGIWDLQFFGYDDALPDFPAAGTSTDKLAFTANYFELVPGFPLCLEPVPQYFGTQVVVTDWVDVLANSATGNVVGEPFAFGGTGTFDQYGVARVALQIPATSPILHVVAQHADSPTTFSWQYVKLTGTVAGTIAPSFQTNLTSAGIVAETTDPSPPTQPTPPATNPVTTAIDSRPTDAIWQNGLMTWVSTTSCTPTGDVMTRDCVRVTQLNTGLAATSTPIRTQDFLIAANGKDNYFGGIGQSGNGTLHVVWTTSSVTAGDQPSSETAYHLPGDPANSLSPTDELAPGIGGEFTGGRWGDFVGVAQDPQVPNAVWQANQYSTGGLNWRTNVSQLQTGGATYVPIDPLRVVDSRIPFGVSGIFNANAPRTFQVAGFTSPGGTIPAGAIAVTGNVTVTGQTAAGYVSITTTATSTPGSSTLNFPTKDNRANNVTTPLASNGMLAAVYKAAAGKKAHVIFDVTGYFLPGATNAGYNTVTPVRVLDTRVPIGLAGRFVSGTPRQLTVVGGVSGIPANAVAITANLTVVGQTKAGFVSVTPTSVPNPTTSNLNFPTGDIRANGLTAKLTAGKLWLVYKATAGARTHLVLDVTGYYLAAGSGLKFFPLDPGRIMDTRSTVLTGLTGLFSHNVSRPLDTDGHWGVPALAKAVTGNLTVVNQTKAGYVSITPTPVLNPTTSTLNFPLGDTRANGVTVPLNGAGNMSLIYKASAGKKTHLILDVTGYFK